LTCFPSLGWISMTPRLLFLHKLVLGFSLQAYHVHHSMQNQPARKCVIISHDMYSDIGWTSLSNFQMLRSLRWLLVYSLSLWIPNQPWHALFSRLCVFSRSSAWKSENYVKEDRNRSQFGNATFSRSDCIPDHLNYRIFNNSYEIRDDDWFFWSSEFTLSLSPICVIFTRESSQSNRMIAYRCLNSAVNCLIDIVQCIFFEFLRYYLGNRNDWWEGGYQKNNTMLPYWGWAQSQVQMQY
jgi:hypothetical protein